LTNDDDIVDLAKSHAGSGLLCSESVLLAISESLGIRSELIPKIATGFGAGIGGQGSICGAITGGVMALGLKLGRENVATKERASYKFASELLTRFEKRYGHINCRDLTGCDFTTEEGRKKYADEKMWETKCRQYIAGATAIVLDILSGKP
jgi:C_GCAxxG_C_C family probable redox protein